jgi:hypothetical protein
MMDQLVAAALAASLIGGALGASLQLPPKTAPSHVNDRAAGELHLEAAAIEKWRSEKEVRLEDLQPADPPDRWFR